MKFNWDNFKQSNVARIFIAYAVVAFGMMQIFDYLLPIIEAPLWVAQTLTLLLFLGFPISLLVGWVTQRPFLSPENEIEEIDPGYAHTLSRQKLILMGLASSALFGFLGFVSMPYLLDQASFNSANNFGDSEAQQAATRRGVRTEVNLGETGTHTFFGFKTEVAIAPDGTKFAYIKHTDLGGEIYIRDLLTLDSDRRLATFTGPTSGKLSFSEDAEWIIYLDNLSMMRVRVEGGAPQVVMPSNVDVSSMYASEQEFYYTTRDSRQLARIGPSNGGEPEILTNGEGGLGFYWPRLLPGGSHMLITSSNAPFSVTTTGKVELLNLNTLEREVLIESAFNAQYARSGHVIFSRDAAIWAVPFDLESLEITGGQVPVVLEVETEQRRGAAIYSFSESGRLIYLRGGAIGSDDGGWSLTKFGRDGVRRTVDLESQLYGHLALSPNESEMAVTIYENGNTSDVWLWDLNRDILGRRTFGGTASRPVWSSDGRHIIYRVNDSAEPKNSGLWTIQANGSSQPMQIFETDFAWPRTVSPSNELVFTLTGEDGDQAYVLDLNRSELEPREEISTQATRFELAPSLGFNVMATVSPNGHWLAYVSQETGNNEVYVRPWPDTESGKWQVSIGGGTAPLWSKTTNEIFYYSARQQWSVSYEEGQMESDERPSYLEFERPDLLASIGSVANPNTINYWQHISETDEFITITASASDQTDIVQSALDQQVSLVVVDDWFSEISSIAVSDQDQ